MKNHTLPKILAGGTSGVAKRQRREQLQQVIACLREAEFPRDYLQFTQFADALRNETVQGKRIQRRWHIIAAQPGKIPNMGSIPSSCPPVIFLPLLQADLAKETDRRWKNLTAGLPSPKRRQAAYEVIPARQVKLFEEARLEEESALQRLRAELDGTAAYKQFHDACQNLGGREKFDAKTRQKKAHRKQDYTPRQPRIRVWSQPMSRADYVEATAHSRKAVGRWLKRIKAKAAVLGSHAAIPDRYGADVNLKILARWIDGIKNPRHASGFAAATMAYTGVYDQPFLPKLLEALSPILKRRNLRDSTAKMLPPHFELYSPKPV